MFRTESVKRGVKSPGVVDYFAASCAHTDRGHDFFGEGLGALDAGSRRRRTEACDTGFAYCVTDPEYQRHLGPNDDQVSGSAGSEFGHFADRRDVNRVLLGDNRCAGVPRRDDESVYFRIATERRQQSMFAGTGTDYEDAHSCQH